MSKLLYFVFKGFFNEISPDKYFEFDAADTEKDPTTGRQLMPGNCTLKNIPCLGIKRNLIIDLPLFENVNPGRIGDFGQHSRIVVR